MKTSIGHFKLLSPLDCVLDRLAWYLFHSDQQSFEQAVEVTLRHRVDLREIEKWVRTQDGSKQTNVERFGRFSRVVSERLSLRGV
jgi:hypothetical protein